MKIRNGFYRWAGLLVALPAFATACDATTENSEFAKGALMSMEETPGVGCVVTENGTGVQEQILYAGQDIVAGAVTVEIRGDNLVVAYTTVDGWYLTAVHLFVGDDMAMMPQTNTGNPKVGLFPYGNDELDAVAVYTETIPLDTFGFVCPGDDLTLFVAAHAVVERQDATGAEQSETGWADGRPITDRGSWATYFDVLLTCNCEDETDSDTGDESCETAFARYSPENTCFIDDGFSRWGWTNGLFTNEAGPYISELYAGAGQCDLEKGTPVGTVTIEYVESTVTVTYDLFSGFGLEETHLYVGGPAYPVDNNGNDTVAPGQFPLIHEGLDEMTDQYGVTDVSGEVHIIAHAKVCGIF